MRRATAIEPGMNVFQWDLRYTPPTEIIGSRAIGHRRFPDTMDGPTILPGEYTVALDYGGKTSANAPRGTRSEYPPQGGRACGRRD